MSKPKVFEKPIGVKDYLPEAVERLRRIERNVLECMSRWGYREIMTPTLEYYDTVGVASATDDRKLFKLLDRWGTTLVMRSDMTAPIARVVASLLREKPLPLRLSYHANVFRAIEEEAGRSSEFYQTGVELVGDSSAEADAEVIALSIASLKAAGVRKFRVAIGHVGFIDGLFEETLPGLENEQEELKDFLLRRDYVGYRDMLSRLGLASQHSAALEGILRLRGGQEVCEHAFALSENEKAREAIRHLCEVLDVLKAYDAVSDVIIDLTMTGTYNYHTGLTFEGYASDLGFPVLNGGRYDNLLGWFGRPAPATGFSLKTNRILEYVSSGSSSGGAGEEDGRRRVLIVYTAEHREEALRKSRELRTQPDTVVTTRRVDRDHEPLKDVSVRADGIHEWNGGLYDEIMTFGRGLQR
ncbi:ATP phosphoribosyltransferase regulatory subunit [Paenibacillus thermotolerans]|uniref:ATP phosphoribosyltransferase regulatory subunit n=1 Tax=Paenibacillus thermotolerans TaxID=3027807 RepID=UPI002367E744|nr:MULTISPECIES: ATP phosphoribosyltransferase regulatory subunit [unclassified Paenibacillus]